MNKRTNTYRNSNGRATSHLSGVPLFKALIVGGLVLLLSACSTTRLIPEDDQLFVGLTKISYEDYAPGQHANETREEVEAALATAPNGAFFGSSYYRSPFPVGLWIWNYTNGSTSAFKRWLGKSFGQAPVLMSQVNPSLRASVAKSVLRNNGYMHGDVSFTEVPQRNAKKMKIGYVVRMDTLFSVDSIAYVNFPGGMQHLIDSTQASATIDSGVPFSVANLDAERTRLSRLFRNNGYYYFQPGYASYLADTLQRPCHAQLRLQLADSLAADVLKPWYIGHRTVVMRRSFRDVPTDTLKHHRSLTVVYSGKRPPLRPQVIRRNITLRSRRAYSYDKYSESVQKMNASGVFSSTDFQFIPRQGTDTLDLNVNCILDKPYDFYIETNFINRTIGRYGPELKVGLTRRNAFRGAEKLDVNLHGSYEWQRGGGGETMNSYQYGADAAIEFPRIITPFNLKDDDKPRMKNGERVRRRRFYAAPWTIAKVSTDIVRRPSYYKMHIVTGEWTYRWQPAYSHRHEFSPLTMKYQYFNSRTEKFNSLLDESPYLSLSMSDYFIPKMHYAYDYVSPAERRNTLHWMTTIEEAGNLSSLYFVAKGRGWNEKEKKMFKNPYSQFVKVETSLTKTWQTDLHSQVVGHVTAGYLHNLGNSSVTPFSESFYVGGANSIRAFPVRSIGPGGMPVLTDSREGNRSFSYVLRNGNVKFQANLEYRTRLFGNLHGAVFLDAGNVWNTDVGQYSIDVKDVDQSLYEESPELVELVVAWWNNSMDQGKLRPSRILRQMATGTGIGLRYDLDFLIIRVDWGFGLHLPYDTGKSGYLNIRRFSDMHTLHFAIGYPF